MLRKITLGIGAAGVSLAMLPLLAAFEAHVVNVTARIENALSVPVEPIAFGTVFPQEQLDKFLPVTLSRSFLEENRVDDVDYIIRQKPKCGVTTDNGEVLAGPTWTGHAVPVPNADGSWSYKIDCQVDQPKDLVLGTDQTAGLLPMLCPYLSKHEVTTDGIVQENDSAGLPAFHQPFTVDPTTGVTTWNDVKGHLSKLQQDTDDRWKIDLKVPCFGGYCAQDWASFVHGVNPDANPDQYTQPISNEHKVFGCNLWLEVTGVSTSTP